jgi:protein TonB
MTIPKTFTVLLIGVALYSQRTYAQDTSKNASAQSKLFVAVEQEPVFPGGVQQFYKYIASNLQYPVVAHLLGLTGKVYLTFVIDRDGTVTDVKPLKCLGAGCESEAVRVVSMSPKWQPGIQKGRPVRVMYTIPISFDFRTENGILANPDKTSMKKLQKSEYGFAFFIKGKTYSLDDAQGILGKSFDPSIIATVEPCADPKYLLADKKETYLVVIKNN